MLLKVCVSIPARSTAFISPRPYSDGVPARLILGGVSSRTKQNSCHGTFHTIDFLTSTGANATFGATLAFGKVFDRIAATHSTSSHPAGQSKIVSSRIVIPLVVRGFTTQSSVAASGEGPAPAAQKISFRSHSSIVQKHPSIVYSEIFWQQLPYFICSYCRQWSTCF